MQWRPSPQAILQVHVDGLPLGLGQHRNGRTLHDELHQLEVSGHDCVMQGIPILVVAHIEHVEPVKLRDTQHRLDALYSSPLEKTASNA